MQEKIKSIKNSIKCSKNRIKKCTAFLQKLDSREKLLNNVLAPLSENILNSEHTLNFYKKSLLFKVSKKVPILELLVPSISKKYKELLENYESAVEELKNHGSSYRIITPVQFATKSKILTRHLKKWKPLFLRVLAEENQNRSFLLRKLRMEIDKALCIMPYEQVLYYEKLLKEHKEEVVLLSEDLAKMCEQIVLKLNLTERKYRSLLKRELYYKKLEKHVQAYKRSLRPPSTEGPKSRAEVKAARCSKKLLDLAGIAGENDLYSKLSKNACTLEKLQCRIDTLRIELSKIQNLETMLRKVFEKVSPESSEKKLIILNTENKKDVLLNMGPTL